LIEDKPLWEAEKNGEREVHTRNLSYFSRKVSAQQFQRLALVEIHCRNVEETEAVAAAMDGAGWEQGFMEFQCTRAIRIQDFAHAAHRLNEIGERFKPNCACSLDNDSNSSIANIVPVHPLPALLMPYRVILILILFNLLPRKLLLRQL